MRGPTGRLRTAAAGDTSPDDGDGAERAAGPGRVTRRVLLAGVAVSALLSIASWVLLAHHYAAYPGTRTYGYWREGALSFAIFMAVGTVLAVRRPSHRVAWVFTGMLVVGSVQQLLGVYGDYALFARLGALPAGPEAAVVSSAAQAMFVGILILLITLFPTGRALSPRWRIVPAAAVFTVTIVPLGVLLNAHPWPDDELLAAVVNPFAPAWWEVATRVVGSLTTVGIATALLGGIAQLIVRYRRSTPEGRLQIRFFTLFAIAGPVVLFAPLPYHDLDPGWVLWTLVPTSLPAAIGIALVKHRLYDIDVVISKTLVFGGLAAFITAIYVVIVVGIGSLLGAGGEPNLALSIVATAVVAVAFQPVRERLTRVANRLVFGHRATPYQVLSRFAGHLADAATPGLILERMAKLVADGTGADRVFVWLRVGERMRATAVWPEVFLLDPVADRALDGGAVFDDFDHVERIHHDGELLGAITISEPRGEALNHTEQELLRDLAGQVALVLRNLRLTGELRERIDELHRSRRRLVRAQDDERRRLERDLHDGAQQQLTRLVHDIRRAKQEAAREGSERAADLLAQVAGDGVEALRTVRDLAHGIYPPVLAAEGLAGALAAQAGKAAVPVTVEVDGIGRYHEDVEAAVYFCVLEAVTNAAKYAHATQVSVRLAAAAGHLVFTVVDDGAGFDPIATAPGRGLTNMADRLAALGGVLDISSRLGDGTEVTGRVHATSRTAAVVPA